MTAGSSNGWQNTMSRSAARARAAAITSSSEAPPSTTVAPYARQDSILVIGTPAGTKMSQGTPTWPAAKASAWAWLPALPTVTPLRARSPSEASLFIAPRILNAPVRWRLSALNTTSRPVSCDSAADGSDGRVAGDGRCDAAGGPDVVERHHPAADANRRSHPSVSCTRVRDERAPRKTLGCSKHSGAQGAGTVLRCARWRSATRGISTPASSGIGCASRASGSTRVTASIPPSGRRWTAPISF